MSDPDQDPVIQESPDGLSYMHSYEIAKLVRDEAQRTEDTDDNYAIGFEVHTTAEYDKTSHNFKHYYIHAPLGSNKPGLYTASLGPGIGTLWYTPDLEAIRAGIDVAARRRGHGKMGEDFEVTHDPKGVMDVDLDDPGEIERWWIEIYQDPEE